MPHGLSTSLVTVVVLGVPGGGEETQEGLLEEGTAHEQSLEVEGGEGRPRELMRSDG